MTTLLTITFHDMLDTAVAIHAVPSADIQSLTALAYSVLAERDPNQLISVAPSATNRHLYPIATLIARHFEKVIGDNPIPTDFYAPIADSLAPAAHLSR